MTLRGTVLLALALGHAGLPMADTLKARKRLDDDYIPFTADELLSRVRSGDTKTSSLEVAVSNGLAEVVGTLLAFPRGTE
jgi:hypothetical protein